MALQESLYALRTETKEAFDEAKGLEARWKDVEREQREVYQVLFYPFVSLCLTAVVKRFTPQFLLMRLKHSTTAQDDASEKLASAFIQQPISTSSSLHGGSGTGTPNGNAEIDEFVREFKDLRKVYHKRVMWGDRWAAGLVNWRDD